MRSCNENSSNYGHLDQNKKETDYGIRQLEIEDEEERMESENEDVEAQMEK